MSIREPLVKYCQALPHEPDVARVFAVDGDDVCGASSLVTVPGTRQLRVCVAAGLLAVSLCGCSNKSPCLNPNGDGCFLTGAYPNDDPHSVCHVCCDSSSSVSDAWTELSQTDTASALFTASVHQGRPFPGGAQFSSIQATWNGDYFSFDGQTLDGLQYHLLTRGRSGEGNLHLYFNFPGDGPVSAAPLNCNIARN